MSRILLVEDNPDLRDELCFQLHHHGHEVLALADGQQVGTQLAAFAPHILLLDLGLPGEDGLSIAARLRQQQPLLGIIMLTARTQLHERLQGHAQSADHYLCKPVELAELLAVVDSLQRRLASQQPTSDSWQLNALGLCLLSPAGVNIALSRNECLLLQCLLYSAAQQASRRALIQALNEDPLYYDERRLEALVSRLRRKISQAHASPCPLKSSRNHGYLFAASLRACP